MTTPQKTPTQDTMGKLALAVAIAAEWISSPSTSKTLLEACDAVEADFDALHAECDALKAEAVKARQQADRRLVEVMAWRADFDALERENTVLKVEKAALMNATSFHPGLSKYCRELENEVEALAASIT